MKDTLFISQLSKSYKNSTEELVKTLETGSEKVTDLGFNYKLMEGGHGKGYITFWYQVLFYFDDIISVELILKKIPEKGEKFKNLYKDKLSLLFEVDDDYTIQPLEIGSENLFCPLGEINPLSNDILNFSMSPFSGITYGAYCGEGSQLLKNRAYFDAVVTTDNCEYLMHSINPATRMMAIEYYYFNLKNFEKVDVERINNWINKLVYQPVSTSTCSGCIVGDNNTKKLIENLKLDIKYYYPSK
ncbi:hypothetical protein GCM10022260_28860 [Gaetbulibacter aestuarii]